MSLKFKITLENTAETIEYGELAPPPQSGFARYALDVQAPAYRADVRKFHVPGVHGNYVMPCGINGGSLVLRVMYAAHNPVNALWAARQDIGMMADALLTVLVTSGGQEVEDSHCTLDHASVAFIEGGRVMIDLEFGLN
ncbi:MAG: hypothetical protein N3A38_14510 [Planctomycetota bacterium]|nr:hypothetical protein [Planctomycetota bacterium]